MAFKYQGGHSIEDFLAAESLQVRAISINTSSVHFLLRCFAPDYAHHIVPASLMTNNSYSLHPGPSYKVFPS